ncbi:MAG: tRNA preQ1(34) S-adenosylmethionine ribosyltransferase-isomerase QueA [Deltaproteobacteria bacterium]|nr:MAG: tRNA preQ1(34) S-adenosylmethionine ribosyltransferase-isomerase QueA [Deltaproteobacteria bacterium]
MKILDITIPKEFIAQYPLKEREKARLMILNKIDGKITYDIFENIDKYLSEKNILVLNNTKVIPARILCKKETGGKIEIFLLKKIDEGKWNVLIRGKGREGTKFYKEELEGKIIKRNDDGSFTVEFNTGDDKEIIKYGEVPLPPYIKRKPEEVDKIYYQTVYAEKDGSIAAPTAGLHFTKRILEKLEKKGVKIVFITLHMGWYSIKVLKNDDNNVPEEYFEIPQKTAEIINEGKKEGKNIIAVGTGTVRCLESGNENGIVVAKKGYTSLFIKPGFKFKIIDGMITNFHLPDSTHIYLVSALTGINLIKKAYEEAIRKKYRFYSYGDSMLIL